MSKKKSTRSNSIRDEVEEISKVKKAPAILKVFFISKNLLKDPTNKLRLEYFYHPGKGRTAIFITQANKQILEVLEFDEPRRSWLVDNDVSSHGKIYMTTPIDVTFFVLYYLRKYCSQKAQALDSLREDDTDSGMVRMLDTFVQSDSLGCVADIKNVGSDMSFYKYNPEKALAWLAIKTRYVSDALKLKQIHCGHSAISHNYNRSEKAANEELQDMDYTRMACDIVGTYIEMDLHEELKKYLLIPSEIESIIEDKKANNKRKSLQLLNSNSKKIKIDDEKSESTDATSRLKSNSLLDESFENDSDGLNNSITKIKQVKEKVLTAKEKSLAKGAKGTMSISSFFKK